MTEPNVESRSEAEFEQELGEELTPGGDSLVNATSPRPSTLRWL